jgi:hypothetical protein
MLMLWHEQLAISSFNLLLCLEEYSSIYKNLLTKIWIMFARYFFELVTFMNGHAIRTLLQYR